MYKDQIPQINEIFSTVKSSFRDANHSIFIAARIVAATSLGLPSLFIYLPFIESSHQSPLLNTVQSAPLRLHV